MKKILAFTIALLMQQSALAQVSDNWTEVNLAVTDNQVIPAYTVFAEAALRLKGQGQALCTDKTAESFALLTVAYHQAMDGWQGVQHIQFGPVTYFNWNFRLQYWPDDKGTGGRQLSTLLAEQSQNVLESENFARASIGVQGFPALERIIYSDEALAELQGDSYRCQLMQTITANISEIAEGIEQRWLDEFRVTVANADERGFFESAEDATIDFLKALVESVPRIQEQKLIPVLGDSFAGARARRAESWRSDRSLRNIKINIAALQTYFYDSGENSVQLNNVLQAEDVANIESGFTNLDSTLAELPDSLVDALQSEDQYLTLKTLVAQLTDLDDLLEAALKNTDLYLGFNSLDGD